MIVKWQDPPPARIDALEWHRLFGGIPKTVIDDCRYYRWAGSTDWNTYLQPPSTFIIYGARYLKKLVFDNSLASLKLWGFMLNEGERLYRARQAGKKIVAVMGDLGPVPVIVSAFPELVPFYPDCLWWTPFLNESTVLLEEAEKHGLGEDCCFVRAALGAFIKRAYFPDPNLAIAATGASCDDMSAVIQQVHNRCRVNIHYLELPYRRDAPFRFPGENVVEFDNTSAPEGAYELLRSEFRELISKLEDLAGHKLDHGRFRESLLRTNRLRRLISQIKEVTYTAPRATLPALEMMNIEFMALSGYGDMEEAVNILEDILATVEKRAETGSGVLDENAVRAAWINPTADPLLLCWWEDFGGRVVATEYLIRQALLPLRESGSPEEVSAQAMLSGSLIGSSQARAGYLVEEARRFNAQGVIISSVFASSHCATETWLLREEMIRELECPVLVFDLAGPAKAHQQAQIRTRMEAFAEMMRARSGRFSLNNAGGDSNRQSGGEQKGNSRWD